MFDIYNDESTHNDFSRIVIVQLPNADEKDAANGDTEKGVGEGKDLHTSMMDGNDAVSESEGEHKRKQGRTTSQLFNDKAMREKQCERVKDFFVKHHLYDNFWTSAMDDKITKYVVCIVNKWYHEGIIKRGIADKGFSYLALVRFFMNDCRVPTEVEAAAIANTIGERKSKRCDAEIEKMVGVDF